MFLKRLILFLLLVVPVLFLNAQSDLRILDDRNTAATINNMQAPDDFVYQLDHMLSNWMITSSKKTPCDSSYFAQEIPDSVISKRLRLMPCIMEMPFNNYVRSFIDL